ncbi:OpgC domain-containing protein [Bradyrhizobium betae]
MSGYTVAFVYARMARARGFLAAALGIFGRAWQLYVAYILLFVFYVVTIGYVRATVRPRPSARRVQHPASHPGSG